MVGGIEGESLVNPAEEFCKRNLRKDEDRKEKEGPFMVKQGFQNEGEMEKREEMMKERGKLRNCDPAWRNQRRVKILGDSNPILNLMNGKWRINNQKFREDGSKKL